MKVTPGFWRQVKEALAATLKRKTTERSAYLNENGCETRARREEELLVAARPGVDGSFQEPLGTRSGSPNSGGEETLVTTDSCVASDSEDSQAGIDQIVPTQAVMSHFGERYRIICKIGEGGMGAVYKAHDNDLNRVVALKVLHPDLSANPQMIQRFKQELLLASRISHKNILRIHDLGDHQRMKFISMAYVEGDDLSHILKEQGRLPIERTIHIAVQLCSALEAAESEGVVHRDLKPANILLDRADNVYVSDFGLAKSLESDEGMTRIGEYVGTPRYMSPEQAEGKPTDHRIDIYALGLILYEMVTGDVPFHADSPWQVIRQRLHERPKIPKLLNPELPEYLSKIILKCLEVNPANRYQHAREVLRDLQQELTPPPPRSMQITVPLLTRRGWLIAGSVILGVIMVGLAIPRVRQFVFHSNAEAMRLGIPSLRDGKFVGVLPFRTVGGDQAVLSYVSEGLLEALSAKLFQLREVHTASASASQAVKQSDSVQEMARQLGINLAISGTIQGTGERVRIIVSLDDVPGGRRLWTGAFSGRPEDLLTLEDQIYAKLVDALALNPSQEERARNSSHPTENVQAYDLYLRGRAAMRGQLDIRNVETAISYYERAVKEDPGFALAYTGLADASLRMYREKKDSLWADKAQSYAQQAQQLDDSPAEVHFALGSVYSATGKSAEAIAELKRALELAPNNDEAYRRLGDAHRASGQLEEAVRAYEKAIEISPYYWFNWNALGSAYLRLGDNNKALQAFEHVAALEPTNAAAYRNIGAVYFQQSRWNESIAAFQKSLRLEEHQVAYSNLGTVFFYLKRYDEAAKMFEKAAQMTPNYPLAIGNLADAYRWSGRRGEAMATYDKAIALAYKELQVNPRDASAMQHLAQYYSRKGDVPQALEFIRGAKSIDPANASLLYTQAVVFSLMDRQDEALKTLNEALQKGFSLEAVKNDPELNKLRTNPQFVQLLNRFGK